MTHHICTGDCKGVSDEPKVCQSPDCGKHGQPLKECNCADGKHDDASKE